MKRLLLLIFIPVLFAVLADARMSLMQLGGGFDVVCDDCTGATKFAFHMEDDDATPDVTLGSPCGCSDGDEVGAETGSPAFSSAQKSDGTYSLHINAIDEYYEFDANGGEIDHDDFKITFDIYIVAYPDAGDWEKCDIWSSYHDANDFFKLQLEDRTGGSYNVTAHVERDSVAEDVHVEVATGSFVSCEWQFKDGVDGNDHKLTCGVTTDEDDDDPAGHDTTPTVMRFGESYGTDNCEYYLDNFNITVSDY